MRNMLFGTYTNSHTLFEKRTNKFSRKRENKEHHQVTHIPTTIFTCCRHVKQVFSLAFRTVEALWCKMHINAEYPATIIIAYRFGIIWCPNSERKHVLSQYMKLGEHTYSHTRECSTINTRERFTCTGDTHICTSIMK